jgi:hypothetical protein
MKLYTEEQVRKLLDKMDVVYSLDELTPIELPSDEEIRKRGWEDADAEDDIAFFVGAKWMKEQILGKEDKTFKQKSKWTEVDNATRRLK